MNRALVLLEGGLEPDVGGIAGLFGHHPFGEQLVVARLVLAHVVEGHLGGLRGEPRPCDLLGAVAGFLLRELGLKGLHGGCGAFDLRRQHLAVHLQPGFKLPQVLLGAIEIGLGLVPQGRELPAVEDGQHLLLLHSPALVRQDLLHPAAHLKGEVGRIHLDRARVV